MARTVLPLDHQAGPLEKRDGHARRGRLLEQPVPRLGCEPHAEPLQRVGREPATGQILAGHGRLGRGLQAIAKPRRCPVERAPQGGAVIGRQPALAAGQLDAGPVGELLERFAKLEPLHPHHEVEHVAADVADPAAVGLPLGVDLQARPRVVVPGTKADEALAGTAQRHV